MENLLPKFFHYKKGRYDEGYSRFYEYCCDKNLPFISVETSGKKYWNIVYDTFTIKKFERFYAIEYDDFVRPFYEDYCEKAKLPSHKSLFGNFSFIVYKKDAPEIAERLFDLLIQLSKRDQELFDENPITVNKEGFNSEGFRVTGYPEELNEMSDDDLIDEFLSIKSGNPLMLQTLELIKNELTKRNITSDKFMK